MVKRYIALFLGVMLLLAGCKANSQTPKIADDRKTVGICLPDKYFQQDAAILSDTLGSAGYQVETEYANGDPQVQQKQIENLISRPVECLIICAIDSMALTQPLQLAKEKNIPVLAYDRMLMYSDAVSGCVAYDTYAAGEEMAKYILEKTQPESRETPVTVEFLMGSPEDHNAYLFHSGLMSALTPYLESGKLAAPSGCIAFEDSCIQDANPFRAQDRFLEQLPQVPAEVLCTYTAQMTQRCLEVLPENTEQAPLTVGIGEKDTTVFNAYGYFDRMPLAKECARWARILLEDPKSLPKKTMQNNGLIDVPVYLQTPTIVK